MEGYLGEFPVDVSKHEKYSTYTKEDWAMRWIEMYGGFDGDHHKTWVIDQVARILNGTEVVVVEARWAKEDNLLDLHKEDRLTLADPSKKYEDWVDEMKGDYIDDGDYEGFEYDWNEGIAP